MLEKRKAYVVRNDGKVFNQGSYYFYIIDTPEDSFEFSLKQLFEINIARLRWFYDNTLNINHKKSIAILVGMFLGTTVGDIFTKGVFNIHGAEAKKLFPEVEILDVDENTILADLEQQLILVNNNYNQEFLRFRTSDAYEFGNSNGIYFRVSSFGFDWFPIIWDIVYNNINFISDVTISGDWQSGKSSEIYKHKGTLIKELPVDEFLNLTGNPIIETYSISDSILSKGGSIFEAHMSNTYSLNMWAKHKLQEYRKNNFVSIKEIK